MIRASAAARRHPRRRFRSFRRGQGDASGAVCTQTPRTFRCRVVTAPQCSPLVLRDGRGGLTQIDHLALTTDGLLVVETKNYGHIKAVQAWLDRQEESLLFSRLKGHPCTSGREQVVAALDRDWGRCDS